MKSKILLIACMLFAKIIIADIPANNIYRNTDPDVGGFNYLPLVLGVLFAIGALAFVYTYKKEKLLN